MKFRQEKIAGFNSYCDTNLQKEMTFDEAMENIEDANNRYFYVSMEKDDVIEAYYNEENIARQLELEPVYIIELGIYILLQP